MRMTAILCPASETPPVKLVPNFQRLGSLSGLRAAFVFLLAAALARPGLAGPLPQDLLRAMRHAEDSVQYSAVMVTQRGGQREVARVYRSGRMRRVEWVQPANRVGDLTVDDGRDRYDYRALGNSVIESKSAPEVPGYRPGAGLPLSVSGPGAYDGRSVFTVKIDGRRTFVIDATTHVLLRSWTPAWSFDLHKVNFGNVAPAEFQYTPPATATVTRLSGVLYFGLFGARTAAPWLKAPGQLPAGFRLDNTEVSNKGVWLRYSDGRRRFSLFEQRVVEAGDNADVPLTSVNGGWFWKSSGIRYLVTGAPADSVPNLQSSLR